MDVLTNVYFDTVNPLADYSRLVRLDVLFSIVFHLIVYLLIFYYGYNVIYLFKNPINNNSCSMLLFLFLTIVFPNHIFSFLSKDYQFFKNTLIHYSLLF